MGMFDEVNFKCLKCGGAVVEQSNAGDCVLNSFSQEEVPIVVAEDISGNNASCSDCDAQFKIITISDCDAQFKIITIGCIPETVPMMIVEI